MARAKIGYINLADAATITATSQLLLAPVSNVTDPNVKRKWRSNTTDDSILIDLGAVTPFEAVAVMGLTGNTVRFRYSTSDATGVTGDVYDSGIVSINQAYAQAVVVQAVNARYVLITISASVFCEAGRVAIMPLHQFGTNFTYGWQRKWIDTSVPTKTVGGQTQIYNKPIYRAVQATFNDIPATELYGDIEDMDRINGLRTDVLFITDPASTNLPRDCVWGLMTSLGANTQQYFGRFSKTYNIEERL